MRRAPPAEDSSARSQKTAETVVDRIRWDSDIDSADFTIGFEDRFLGVLERRFNKFDWDDMAQHRLLYFKYKGVIVWDKRGEKADRVDDVFGKVSVWMSAGCVCVCARSLMCLCVCDDISLLYV